MIAHYSKENKQEKCWKALGYLNNKFSIPVHIQIGKDKLTFTKLKKIIQEKKYKITTSET